MVLFVYSRCDSIKVTYYKSQKYIENLNLDYSLREKLTEFILFKQYIAEDVLIVFYVLCAITIPIATWYFLIWAIRRYAIVIKFYKSGQYSLIFSLLVWIIRKIKFIRDKMDEKISWKSFDTTQKLKFLLLYLGIVFFAELFLRLMFEYLIAFIQIHDWLRSDNMSSL